MEFTDKQLNYSKDSQRVEDPRSSIRKLESELRIQLGVKETNLTHKLAPDIKIKLLENNCKPFYWKQRTASRGKGITESQSLASALGEHIERYAATVFIENNGEHVNPEDKKLDLEEILPSKEMVTEHGNDLSHLYSKGMKTTCSIQKNRFSESIGLLFRDDSCRCWSGLTKRDIVLEYLRNISSSREDWTNFHSLRKNEEIYIPMSLLKATTNGLAAGNCTEEAVLHGLFEVIERDEAARTLPEVNLDNLERCTFLRTEDIPDTIKENFNQEELEKILVIHSKSSLCPSIHVFQALVFCKDENPGFIAPEIEVAIGKGANMDPYYALQRSLTEVVQCLASSKDVNEIIDPTLSFEKKYVNFSNLTNKFDNNLKNNIETFLDSLDEKADAFIKDITHPEFSTTVVKCVITGSIGPNTPKIGTDLYEDVLDRKLSLAEKIMVKRKEVLL